jgi:hypothetical protein
MLSSLGLAQKKLTAAEKIRATKAEIGVSMDAILELERENRMLRWSLSNPLLFLPLPSSNSCLAASPCSSEFLSTHKPPGALVMALTPQAGGERNPVEAPAPRGLSAGTRRERRGEAVMTEVAREEQLSSIAMNSREIMG